ncbi:MAG: hypothetical protein AB7M05_03750 [Alphaproteobacteria bacterium]
MAAKEKSIQTKIGPPEPVHISNAGARFRDHETLFKVIRASKVEASNIKTGSKNK